MKNLKALPNGLEEWPANIDFESLEPIMQSLARCIERGFGTQEIAEVIGVAEETKPNRTKTFRFSVTAKEAKSELWLVIFMDDIDGPSLGIHANAAVIQEFVAPVPLKD